MRVYRAFWLTSVALCCATLPLQGQEARGTLLGRVSDPSTAVIATAKVEAVNAATGVRFSSTTNESGDFLIPFLIPGPYTITVEHAGFKMYSRKGIVVRVNDQVSINVVLELGEATQTVNVSAESPMLDTSTASMGQVVESRTILELPLKDGMVLVMATLAPGVTFTPESAGYVRPFDTGSPSTMSIDGTRSGSNQFMMDGAPNMQGTQVAYSPPPGVVDEFKVQGVTFDAGSGFMGGAAINMSLKSGANDVHGQVYYFMQNPVLNANKYFRLAVGKPQFRLYRWGGSVSGPLVIPKVYDGHNKTFFMYGYEGIWSFDPSPWVVEAVPTAAQRTGDFSNLLALGANYQIYDPYSIAPAGSGRFSRQPLPGNIVPANRINPASAKIAALWDLPNQAGTADGTNNYQKGKNAQDTYWNHIVRIDHNLSQAQRFYVRVNFTDLQRPENVRHNNAVGDNFYRYNKGFAFDDVHVFSPRFFLNTRYTLTRFITGYTPFQAGWDLAGAGFSSAFINQINAVDPRALKLPNIAVSSYSSLGGVNSRNNTATDIHEWAANATTILGSHTLRYGFAYRIYRNNTFNLGNSSGNFNFDATWTRGPLDNSPTSPSQMGQSFAGFLYGLPGSGNFPINDSYAEQSKVPAVFFQDDWKVNQKLTLSLGLRWERPSPVTERFDRSIRGFDAAAASPIQAQAKANYALNPIPQLPASQFNVLGGLTFAGANGLPRTLWKTSQNFIMPRFGFAYSITPKTVLRGGYGIFYDALGVVSTHVNQIGFTQNTDLVTSTDNGQSYIANLSNPFPGGFLPPLKAAGGLATSLGQGISFFDENTTPSYMQRWQLMVQRQLPKNHLVEVSYVGNRGTRLLIGRDLNPVPRQYYSTSPFRDQAAIDLMSAQVNNPFYPLLPKTGLSATTVARNQLLKPYPQFTGLGANQNEGYSWYHSMQVRFERRFAAGLNAGMSYTWSKMMEAVSYLNSFDTRPEEVISSQDRTHRLALTGLYELPFGPGKPLLGSTNKVASRLVSGWQIQGIYTLQSGGALGFGNAIFTGNLKDIPLPKDQRTVSRWFNIDAGFDRATARQLSWNVRTLSSRFSGIRSDGPNNIDLSVIKNTQIKERLRLQFRAEAINFLNHPQFTLGSTNTSPTSSAFGTVTGEFAWPRVIQFGLKVLF
ncbi:MAG: TonB-dependent receptor [Candidatus Solibacter sp.]|nr:TonB-dependent receptor [Candidatus Solibacter sp.]